MRQPSAVRSGTIDLRSQAHVVATDRRCLSSAEIPQRAGERLPGRWLARRRRSLEQLDESLLRYSGLPAPRGGTSGHAPMIRTSSIQHPASAIEASSNGGTVHTVVRASPPRDDCECAHVEVEERQQAEPADVRVVHRRRSDQNVDPVALHQRGRAREIDERSRIAREIACARFGRHSSPSVPSTSTGGATIPTPASCCMHFPFGG